MSFFFRPKIVFTIRNTLRVRYLRKRRKSIFSLKIQNFFSFIMPLSVERLYLFVYNTIYNILISRRTDWQLILYKLIGNLWLRNLKKKNYQPSIFPLFKLVTVRRDGSACHVYQRECPPASHKGSYHIQINKDWTTNILISTSKELFNADLYAWRTGRLLHTTPASSCDNGCFLCKPI